MSGIKLESPPIEETKKRIHDEIEELNVKQEETQLDKKPIIKRSRKKSEEINDTPNNFEWDDEEFPEEIAKQYKKYSNAPKFNLNSEEVFCICRKPDHGGLLMISCDGCDDWFHFKCMKLNVQYQKLVSKFYCKFCRWKEVGQTQWKRKCRVPTCFEPISLEGDSKYCSEKCGLKFISSKLPQVSEIKSILLFSVADDTAGEDYRKLSHLGSKFPQLPEVVEYLGNPKDVSKFPLVIQLEINELNKKVDEKLEILDNFKLKLEFLTKTKEKLKIINENLVNQEVETKQSETTSKKSKKSGKSKKFDICGYEKTLNYDYVKWSKYYQENKKDIDNLISGEYSDSTNEQIKEIVSFYHLNSTSDDDNTWFQDRVCIKDKRKCLRHGGWWGLIHDEISKKIGEYNADLKNLEREKQKVLRNYSVQIFEQN